MGIENKDFFELVSDANSGKLMLPQFQRDFKWQSPKVLRLFNSIRKGFPIGGFLTLESSDDLYLYPRSFYGVDVDEQEQFRQYVLDGQQRITAGLALCYGIGLGKQGRTHYFLNIGKLWKTAEEKNLNYDDPHSIEEFAESLDDEDGYVIYKQATNPAHLLETQELLHTPALADFSKFQYARTRYLEKHPSQQQRELFMDELVRKFFGIAELAPRDRGILVPVTELGSEMPVAAITTVFETLNTTGQRLTPVEIVTAILFGAEINLRDDIDSYKNQKTYYRNLDDTGELFLQTIALLSGENSKKNELPRTISANNYKKHRNASVEALDLAGKFLSDRFQMWIDANAGLVPYPAMLPPLGIALTKINQIYSDVSDDRTEWYRRLDRWFVGSVFTQRYRDSQPATQQSDLTELDSWIANGEEPSWMERASIPVLDDVAPKSATGKLITCLINRQDPREPMDGKTPVGGMYTNINSVHSHHIFPKGYCKKDGGIPDWRESDDSNLAVNLMPITNDTNQNWDDDNPSEQVQRVLEASEGSEEELFLRYAPFFIDRDCLNILRKQHKKREDFVSFIKLRGKLIQDYVANEFNFGKVADHSEDDEEEL